MLRTTYTLATQTHPFFDPPLGLPYNAPAPDVLCPPNAFPLSESGNWVRVLWLVIVELAVRIRNGRDAK